MYILVKAGEADINEKNYLAYTIGCTILDLTLTYLQVSIGAIHV